MADFPQRKPMAVVRRVALFEREIRLKLSQSALEILFDSADILSEGERRGSGWFGSTMITLDLARVAHSIRESCDSASAGAVAQLAADDTRVRARARALATADATERAGAPLARIDCELRARAVGIKVHLDVDVEAEVSPARAGGAA